MTDTELCYHYFQGHIPHHIFFQDIYPQLSLRMQGHTWNFCIHSLKTAQTTKLRSLFLKTFKETERCNRYWIKALSKVYKPERAVWEKAISILQGTEIKDHKHAELLYTPAYEIWSGYDGCLKINFIRKFKEISQKRT